MHSGAAPRPAFIIIIIIIIITLNKKGINSKDIVNKICKGRKIIGCLNSLWWDKNVSLETKKRLGKGMVESVACYGCEV